MEDGKVAANVAWKTRDMDCQHGGYIIHEGYVYGNDGGDWTCLDLKTGKKQWKTEGGGQGLALLRRRHALPVQRE